MSAPPSATPAGNDLCGRTIGRFRITTRLGSGGMGEVYRAEDTVLHRAVAVKRIVRRGADENYRRQFLREAERASALNHPHIATVYDVVENEGELFLVMELVPGSPLRARLAKPVPLEAFHRLATEIASALAAAHERGIIHCDLKPENIMLTAADEVKVLDFGVARQVAPARASASVATADSVSSNFGGTPAYMAPEVLMGHAPDSRSDIFSLGVVFFELLTGEHPFQRGSGPMAARIIETQAPVLHSRRHDAPPALDYILAKMLAHSPDERYSSARELLVDLQAAAQSPASVRWQMRRPGTAGKWIAAAFLVAAIAAALLYPRWHRAKIAPLSGSKNLAVIPFRIIGDQPDERAYSDGIAETLTAKLTQLTATHDFSVAPAEEVHAHKVATPEDALQELGANLVLEGSLQRSGNQMRVAFSLVDMPAQRQVAAETVTAATADVFSLEDQVVESAVRMLELHLDSAEQRQLTAHGTGVSSAHELYLRGRGLLEDYDRLENVRAAADMFQRAAQADPGYALAFAGLAEAEWRTYELNHETYWAKQALDHCRRAVELDGQLSEAHACTGMVAQGTGKFELARDEYQLAEKENPTSDAAVRGLAEAYEKLGQAAAAERTYQQAIALRPRYWGGYLALGGYYLRSNRLNQAADMYRQVIRLVPNNLFAYSDLGVALLLQGNYQDAIPLFQKSNAIRPTDAAYSNLGVCYFYLRQFAQAAANYQRASEMEAADPDVFGNLGEAYFWAPGERSKAEGPLRQAIRMDEAELAVNPKDLDKLEAVAQYHAMLGERKPALDALRRALAVSHSPEVMLKAAVVYAHLGEKQTELEWLRRALAAGLAPSLINDDPTFDSLRDDPEFSKLKLGS